MKVTPETLTGPMVESLIDRAHPNEEGLDPNYAPDRYLAQCIRIWKRDPKDTIAARKICAAINALNEANS